MIVTFQIMRGLSRIRMHVDSHSIHYSMREKSKCKCE